MSWGVTSRGGRGSRGRVRARGRLTDPFGSATALAMASSLVTQLASFCFCCSSSV